LVALLASTGAPVWAQEPPPLRPFVRPGEELTFRVRSARFGDLGTATMRVAEDTVDGRLAYRLMFDFDARVLVFGISDHTRSWLDPLTLSTLRYEKDERSPVGRRQESVTVNPADSSWTAHGTQQPLASAAPLDELSIIYLVRSLDPLASGPLQLERHFDRARNPIQLCLLERRTIEALGQTFDALVVQLDVPDARQRNGRNRLRFYISDDANRLVLRIDSSMPMAGTLTLTLIDAR
jgi:hypothetical protein